MFDVHMILGLAFAALGELGSAALILAPCVVLFGGIAAVAMADRR